MKLIVIPLFLLALPAFAYTPDRGCIWNGHKAHCIVKNNTDAPLKCSVKIHVKTANGITIGTTHQVRVPKDKYETVRVYASPEDKIVSVTAESNCK